MLIAVYALFLLASWFLLGNHFMILITGSTGFLGRSVENALKGSRKLRLAVRNPLVINQPCNSEIVSCDLKYTKDWSNALASVEVVIHCAARVHVMNEDVIDPLAEFRSVNVEGTLRLARQAAVAGVRRFIFISSIKVNGESTQLGSPFTPADEPKPLDPYGISKMEAEQGLRELSLSTGMEVVIIRPPLVYGRGVKANFATMMQWLKRGYPLPLGSITSNRRSLVYLENLVDLICLCVSHPKAANQTFLVSDNEDVSTTALLRKMAKSLGCPARLVNISPTLIKLSTRLIGKPGISDRLCGSLQVDITKTQELLGWTPKFSLDEGLLRTANPR